MLIRLQQLLVEALRHPDPNAWLREQLANCDDQLSDQERQWLLAADADGLRLSRMLVRKLRLQRVLLGDVAAGQEMADDPTAFAQRFADYDRDTPLLAVFPRDEAAAFRNRD